MPVFNYNLTQWVGKPATWVKARVVLGRTTLVAGNRDISIGNPKASTSEKGKRFFETITEKIADVFLELAKSDIDHMCEY